MSAYKCHKCDHTTSRKTSLAQHVKRLHEEVEEDPDSSAEDVMSGSPAKMGKQRPLPVPSDLHLHSEGETSGWGTNQRDDVDGKDKGFKCAECGFANHKVNADGNKRSFECEECGIAAAWKTSLQEHRTQKNVQEEEEKSVYKCEKCDYRSTWPGNITKHFNNVHEKVRNHRCSHEECSYATAYRADLVRHMHKLHGTSPGQKCKLCDFTSSQRGAIIRHFMKVHDGGKVGNIASRKQNLKKTKSPSEHAEDPFDCETEEESDDEDAEDIESDVELDGEIPDKSSKRVAMAANVNDSTKCEKYPDNKAGRAKMYKCDKCDHASSRKSSLAQHVARVHEVEEGSESDQSGDESPPQSENSTMSVKMVGEEDSNGGGSDNVPSKRAPLAAFNKALNDPDHQTENVNFAIPISLESLGFLEGLSPNELL